MNEKIQEHLGVLLEYLEKGFGFAAEQMPVVVQEILAWGFWSNVADAVFYSLCAAGAAAAALFFARLAKKEGAKLLREQEPVIIACGWTLSFGLLISVCVFLGAVFSSLKMCLMVSLAPRVYLIEMLKEMSQ